MTTTVPQFKKQEDVAAFFSENPDAFLTGEGRGFILTEPGQEGAEHHPLLRSVQPVILFRDVYDDRAGRGWGPHISISGYSDEFHSKMQPSDTYCVDLNSSESQVRVAYESLHQWHLNIHTLLIILRIKERNWQRIQKPAVDPLRQLRIETNRANATHFNRMFRPGHTVTEEDISASIKLLEGYRTSFLHPQGQLVPGKKVQFRNGDYDREGIFIERFPLQNKAVIQEENDNRHYVIPLQDILKVL